MSHHTPTRTLPVRVLPVLPPLLEAGLRVVLTPHADQVDVVSSRSQAPEVIVFDPMYDEAHARLARAEDVPLVAMTGTGGAGAVARAHRFGASQLLELSCPAPDLVTTLWATAVGGDEPERASRRESPTEYGVLSPRETEVIALVCRGLSNHEISAELFLGINTIKTYIRTAYRKMGVTSRSQAVLWGLERGVIAARH